MDALQLHLKELRKSRKMTQSQLGLLTGMGKSQISRMEHGLLGSPDTYGRVLEALGYDLEVSFHDRWASSEKKHVLDVMRAYCANNRKRLGIERMGLFGSMVREEQGPGSDIDVCLSLSRPNLILYSEIADDLKQVLGRKIDLVSLNAKLPHSFRKQLEKEVEYVG
ncbi:MAG: nucleotidyltransferase domain-containing protein [Bacteroidales bacterium]|nr:nucleotidyltransferase domain-containing protein [Bacteroidales bacterium]